MELDDLKRLLGLLTANGVSYFKDAHVEMRLETAGSDQPIPLAPDGPTLPDPYTQLMGNRARFPGGS